jgi:hypothetical protein
LTTPPNLNPLLPELTMPAPIFIIGSMGSGSTLIRLMLDSHERIAIPQETSFMRLVQTHRWVPHWRYGGRWSRRLNLKRAELDAYLRAFYGGLFERYARMYGKERWGEKTPHHVWHMWGMAKLFPDAVFLGIVRHPGGTTGSLVGRFNYQTRRSIRHWVNVNREMVHHGIWLGDRFALIRYEDLVQHSEDTMREVLEWLGENWSESVLRHHEVQLAQGARKVIDGGTRPTDPLDPSRASRWTDRFDDADLDLIREHTEAFGGFFGYGATDPFPVETLAPAESGRKWLVTGRELRPRREEFADRVDFSRPEKPKHEVVMKYEPAVPPPPPPPPPLRARARRAVLRRLPQPVRRRLSRVRASLSR